MTMKFLTLRMESSYSGAQTDQENLSRCRVYYRFCLTAKNLLTGLIHLAQEHEKWKIICSVKKMWSTGMSGPAIYSSSTSAKIRISISRQVSVFRRAGIKI